MNKKSDEKAKQFLDEERIFKLSETDRYEYYICKGASKKVYEIIEDKLFNRFSCNCKNIRLTDCSHIKAAKLLQGDMYENETANDHKGTMLGVAI
ncbi:hypothetical protein [Oceanihabitans sediminis]|uniref:hypothetical protein n=1 Tax=Oceanihabitans sediminis TaxID=1812012 RepID=UPI00299DDA5C|nr:hypothetical protein [Oceanihabitans sediminis]MDX1279470.1 hypothetical protein [Oceanihabitans sediminis]